MGRLWLLILCGCAFSHSAKQESSFEQATKQEETTQATITFTTEEGAWTRRVWEYGAPQDGLRLPEVQGDRADGGGRATAGGNPVATAPGNPEAGGGPEAPEVGSLIRYTEEEHGPRTEETRAEAKGASLASGAVKAAGESKDEGNVRLGPSFFSWIGIAAVVALAGFISAKAGWPPFLLPLWKLLRLA